MKRLMLVAAAVAGCRECEPLGDARILGADVKLATGIWETLERMDGEVVPPVCLSHVRAVPPAGQRWGGRYNTATRGIRIRDDVPAEYLEGVLGHEICHGVDLQNDFVKGSEDLYFYADPDALWPERRLPNEAFADTCVLGRDALAAVGPPECPDVPDLRAVEAVRADVYGAEAPAPGLVFERVASVAIDGPIDSVAPVGLTTGIGLFLTPTGESFTVDAWTGARLATGVDLDQRAPGTGPAADGPPSWWGSGRRLADGTDVFMGTLPLPTGPLAQLIHMRPDGPRTVIGLCAADEPQLFSFEGDTWAAVLGDGEIWWGRFEPIDP